MKAVRTPALLCCVLRVINLNVEIVLSLVFSLDYVSPGVWITNVFLRKISWNREFCFYHPRFMLNTLVKIKKSWFGRGLQKMNFIFWCCYEGRLYSLMNMTYTIISLAIMWLIAIMNMTMMIMRSRRKITIKSILLSWSSGESRLDPDPTRPAETEKAQLSGQLPHPWYRRQCQGKGSNRSMHGLIVCFFFWV